MAINYNYPVVGKFYRCGSLSYDGVSDSDIFAKVLHICEADNKIMIARTTECGFKALPPQTMDIQDFMTYYFDEIN